MCGHGMIRIPVILAYLVSTAWGLPCSSSASAPGAVLPEGDAPPAIVTRHFPDRIHEFIWRNWNVVDASVMAKVLKTDRDNVTALGESMGLPSGGRVPPEMKTRGYITIIRRNWHLLPYAQLLELLEMTPERLAFTLREDDFLWAKLGRLKPKCAPLIYLSPGDAAKARAAEIRRIVEGDFGEVIGRTGRGRFDFVRELSAPIAGSASEEQKREGPVALKLVYSYLAVYGDPLSDPELDPYPDGFLARLASVGINGVWLHAVLRDLAPGGSGFPEFGAGHERRLSNLRRLVERARRHGIGVYLYMNEPRAMPTAFFKDRPEMAGVREAEFSALCTSNPAVRQWMGDALAYVFREVPDLAGVYSITASENLTNCASHGNWKSCERCKSRTDAEIIAEVAAVIEAGVRRGAQRANVIFSDWGWRGHGDARDIVARLPKSSWLMSVSEWGLPIERGGIKSKVGEYSISAVGPGPRAPAHWITASAAGVKTAAEIQLNNTCEIASLPYLPVMDLVAEHLLNLASHKPDGMLIGWTMGGHPSPNFQLAQRMDRLPVQGIEGVLNEMALERFGPAGAAHARAGWRLLSDAFRQYPFHIRVIYTSPVQWGVANPMHAAKTGYSATMWGLPYDDIDGWRGPYPPEIYVAQFEKVAEGFRAGVPELQMAIEKAPPERRREVEADLRYARAAAITFQSVANQGAFVIARDTLKKLPPEKSTEQRRLRAEIRVRLESEIELSKQLLPLVLEDSRIGFEPSCQYFYLPLDLVEKVINCRWLLEAFCAR